MFFNKKPEQVAAPRAAEETLEWENGSRRSQSFRIIAASWFFKTAPMLRYQGGRKVEFTFEGRARLGAMPNVPVYGEIEVVDDITPHGFFKDHWKKVPECVEGYAYLSFTDEKLPQLYVTLYCTAEALDWVSRVFVAGFSSVGGKAALDLDIAYPDGTDNDFWKKRWQSVYLQVAKWDVRASAERD